MIKLKYVIEKFQNEIKDLHFTHYEKNGYNFLYLLKEHIINEIPKLKTKLKELFQLTHYSGLQIIGDSAAFSDTAHQFLLKKLTELKTFKGLIFYGFTGEGANGIVADLVKNEIMLAEKVMANIVANESLTVIEAYQCPYSKTIKNFLIVDDGMGGCHFGDDINLSDSLAEQLICLEGGVISFGQILNTLIRHDKPQITMYTGLRNKDNADLERSLFSASELFFTLKQAIQANRLENSDQLEEVLYDYLKQHRLDPKNNANNELNKQTQVQTYFEQFKLLDKVTQGQIINKINDIQTIHYSGEFSPEKTSHLMQKELTQFFLTHKKGNSPSEVIQAKSLKIHG